MTMTMTKTSLILLDDDDAAIATSRRRDDGVDDVVVWAIVIIPLPPPFFFWPPFVVPLLRFPPRAARWMDGVVTLDRMERLDGSTLALRCCGDGLGWGGERIMKTAEHRVDGGERAEKKEEILSHIIEAS
jgi:hypothetical protein